MANDQAKSTSWSTVSITYTAAATGTTWVGVPAGTLLSPGLNLEIPISPGIPIILISPKQPGGATEKGPALPDGASPPLTTSGLIVSFKNGQPPQVVWQTAPLTSSVQSSNVASSSASGLSGQGQSPTSTNDNVSPSSTSATKPTASAGSKKVAPGVTTGAAAGIAIGCLIAGALIAGILFWFCWGRRRNKRAGDREASSVALVPHEKGFSTKATSLGSGSAAVSPVNANLPLPLEDKAITGEISKISNSIKNHVQSYYHSGRVSPGLLDLDDIQAIGHSLPISVGTLSTLLGNSATREIALRFCIAWVVCSRMRPSTNPRESLLPVELTECSQKIEAAHSGSTAHNALVGRWRVMTAQLVQPSYVRDPFNVSDSRNESIRLALDALENILQPFADSRMDNGQRRRNLEEILKRSATFAFTLFSQPSTWDFDWREEQGVKSGELCIFPALVQVSDDSFQPINPPRPFSEAVVRRLSG